ncbi:MAG: 2-oxoglutarate dehydrogenase, E2 component, dihydrolipoamide succinyltransferase [Nocardioidaceae bacterium]
MATAVNLPALGESVTEGTVTRWLKQPGDQVAVDEPLLEVSTDKVDTEIPSPVAGTLLEIKAAEDETVEVGAELCTVGDENEAGGSGDAGGGGGTVESGAQSGSEAQVDPDSGAETPDTNQAAASGSDDDQPEKKSQPEGDVPAASTDGAPPAQETATGSADTRPEAEASGAGTSPDGSGTSVTLPALGESVTEGTVTRWLKQVGDEVAVDEPLLEVSTDKVDTEIPSPVAGRLLEIKVQEDETVEVGSELAVIGSGEPGESGGAPQQAEPSVQGMPDGGDGVPQAASQQSAPQATPDAGQAEQASAPTQTQAPEKTAAPDTQAEPVPSEEPTPGQQRTSASAPSGAPSGESTDGGPYVTPLVRKMAAEHGVDLSSITGSGVGGRIRKQDVLDAAKAQQEKQAAPAQEAPAQPAAAASGGAAAPSQSAPSPLRGRTEPMTRLRKVIAKRMVESLQVSAQLTTVVEVDVTSIARLRDRVKNDFASREGVKLSFLPFFAKAAIDAQTAHPSLNASIDTEKGEVTYFDHENLSIAVDTEKGLLTPVIKEAGDLSIAGLARKIADIADRTRNNKIGPDELAGGTFTLTNTGSRGALFDTPIINQPQVAILGTGAVVKRAMVIDDPNLGETIAVRRMVYLALTYDHRIVDGADAARFLVDVKQRLESGQFDV